MGARWDTHPHPMRSRGQDWDNGAVELHSGDIGKIEGHVRAWGDDPAVVVPQVQTDRVLSAKPTSWAGIITKKN
jgi:hypothetical protein